MEGQIYVELMGYNALLQQYVNNNILIETVMFFAD